MFTKVQAVDVATVTHAIQKGSELDLTPRFIGEGDAPDEAVLGKLGKKIQKLARKLPPTRAGHERFDHEVAVLLHKELALSPVAASEPGFWTYFALRYAQEGLRFRWNRDIAHITPSRYAGKWKDTYRRLWLRATLAHDPDAVDPYHLVKKGGEDFWVQIIERSFSRCSPLVRAIVSQFTQPGMGDSKEQRRGFIWLRQVQPVRAFDLMEHADLEIIVQDALKRINPKPTRSSPTRASKGKVRRSRRRRSSAAARAKA